jgi:Fe-S-cluster containining protein
MELVIDRAELGGLGFRCLEGCAYCCLCPAEVSDREKEYFLKSHPSALDDLDGTPHIALRGGSGACVLLRERRCTDYAHRPFHCRAFPLRVHIGYRVQACANLSCRGIGHAGEAGPPGPAGGAVPLSDILHSILEGEEAGRLAQESQLAAREWHGFLEKSKRNGIPVMLENTRASAASAMERWPNGLEPDQEEVLELVTETFGTREPAELPVYTSPGLEWWVFRVRNGEVERFILSEDGSLKPEKRWPLRAVPLLELSSGGAEELRRYMALLNGRDSIAAAAALVSKLTRFEEEFEEVYFENFRDCALDLLWRASLLAFIKGESVLGPAEVREGIIFSDADFLDMPGIGGML